MLPGLTLSERNLILTGYVEPNKPRIGRQVAAQLRRPFVDIEEVIEQRLGENQDVIRSSYGERRLKTIEVDVLADISLYRAAVIRVNGSTLIHSEHLEKLQETGFVVCLVARLDAILRQMHLTMGARYHNPAERAAAIGELKREWAVRKLPGLYEIDVTNKDEAGIIASVIELWQQIAVERA